MPPHWITGKRRLEKGSTQLKAHKPVSSGPGLEPSPCDAIMRTVQMQAPLTFYSTTVLAYSTAAANSLHGTLV